MRPKRVALSMILGLLSMPTLRGQVSGMVSGTVADASGATVPDANVTIKNTDLGTQRSTSTGGTGHYELPLLPVGNYEIYVFRPGFDREARSGIKLAVGENAIVDFQLRVGEAREQVSVTEDAPIVSPTNADISGLVTAEQVKNLPLNGRS